MYDTQGRPIVDKKNIWGSQQPRLGNVLNFVVGHILSFKTVQVEQNPKLCLCFSCVTRQRA